jgi:hypothetical protein
MIRDSVWALSLAPTSTGAGNGAAAPPLAIAPANAPRRLAVIDSVDSPVPAGASLPGTMRYTLDYQCQGNGKGNGQSTGAVTDGSTIKVGPDTTPKWAIWVPVTAAGLFILDWMNKRRKR